MPSIRNSSKIVNEYDSKATRMDIASASVLAGWRPDELTHISRYDKIVGLMLDESKRLGRPIDLLEAGCGELWTLRLLYKAYVIKKSDVVRSYVGLDIDPAVKKEHKFWPNSGGDICNSKWLQQFNAQIHVQDLVANFEFPTPKESVDFFYTTEVIEHMDPSSVEPWVQDASERLRPGGLGYFSTPNSSGSRQEIPEDHVYEWSFTEMKEMLSRHFTIEQVIGTFIQMPKFAQAQEEFISGKRTVGWSPEMVEVIRARFGRHWQRVILAAPYPEVANNCAWIVRKK